MATESICRPHDPKQQHAANVDLEAPIPNVTVICWEVRPLAFKQTLTLKQWNHYSTIWVIIWWFRHDKWWILLKPKFKGCFTLPKWMLGTLSCCRRYLFLLPAVGGWSLSSVRNWQFGSEDLFSFWILTKNTRNSSPWLYQICLT